MGNSLHGTIPLALGKLTRLDLLALGENQFTVARFLHQCGQNLNQLEWIYISENMFTGKLRDIQSLETVFMTHKFFTGTISDYG